MYTCFVIDQNVSLFSDPLIRGKIHALIVMVYFYIPFPPIIC